MAEKTEHTHKPFEGKIPKRPVSISALPGKSFAKALRACCHPNSWITAATLAKRCCWPGEA